MVDSEISFLAEIVCRIISVAGGQDVQRVFGISEEMSLEYGRGILRLGVVF